MDYLYNNPTITNQDDEDEVDADPEYSDDLEEGDDDLEEGEDDE